MRVLPGVGAEPRRAERRPAASRPRRCAGGVPVAAAALAARSPAAAAVVMMGRHLVVRQEKMARTALANMKKASYIGKKVVIAVKANGYVGSNSELDRIFISISKSNLSQIYFMFKRFVFFLLRIPLENLDSKIEKLCMHQMEWKG